MAESNPKPYQWDYDGSCRPGRMFESSGQRTFSVGIFQWLPRGGGKGLKRGKVVQRISGSTSAPDEVYAKAKAACELHEQLYLDQQAKAEGSNP